MRQRGCGVALLMTMTLVAACGSGDGDSEDAAGAATPCLPGEGDSSTSIRVTVDDDSDGFGSVGSRTPSDLAAGTIRVDLESSEDNEDPIDVPIYQGDREVFRFVGVEPGVICGVELELTAGTYRVAFGQNDAEFTID